ncbi:peptidyl-glycine alpha-amidating monooxygenase B isoform X1 [Rhipicephalus microplus]|nr:peptidylglycine alpha-amidating monooxygenase-like isoform X1 [Rhipicephalus microplus]
MGARLWSWLMALLVGLQFAPLSEGLWRRGEPPHNRQNRLRTLLRMPGVEPTQPDDYYCTAYNLSYEEAYIVNFKPKPNHSTASHMLLIGCGNVFRKDHLHPGSWNCDRNAVCDNLTVLYGWARNAASTQLPEGVGFQVGQQTSVRYLVLQVHYDSPMPDGESDTTGLELLIDLQPQRYLAGIHVFYAKDRTIPPGHTNFPVDVNCVASREEPIFVFAYRVHTHSLGHAVTAYLLHNGRWSLLVKGDPHQPQAFYPLNKTVPVKPGDVLASRCTYNTVSRALPTEIGPGARQEMCNLYLMYYALRSSGRTSGQCENLERPALVSQIPLESGDHDESVVEGFPATGSHYSFSASEGWPDSEVHLGQVVAVSMDLDGNLVVFHRGSRVWTAQSFDFNDVYQRVEEGPIPESTVLTLEPGNGHLLHRWGHHQFFMPHGLTVDREGFIWLTDVALHQIHKYPPGGAKIPLLSLGERFQPGGGKGHFCKPTSVAIASGGDFYVADGYCNSRVVHFDKGGKFLRQIGEDGAFSSSFVTAPPGSFAIPHKIVVADSEGLFCVADRENGRVQCFDIMDGSFKFEIAIEAFRGKVYSIAYSGGLLLAVSGPRVLSDPSRAFLFNLTSRQLLASMAPPSGSFMAPHDIACSKDIEQVYVGEIGPNRLWRFVREMHRSSKKVLVDVPPPAVPSTTPPSTSRGESSSSKLPTSAGEEDNFGFSMVVVALLAIPILSFLIITLIVRLKRRKDKGSSSKGWSQGKLDLGQLLQPHRGFDRLALDDTASEGSDSDVEEYNAPARKA